ncbi:MAG: hypothetical protein GFH27_549423n8 [Chloroflexi bacterium AL-W]|nr:hypothetical protein [Chloroflexi bacterium AL-N1]NOK71512.1 hypothetical protein [Chloroflexi bacterium AL-N10]NOK78858.1 hypothetical protein [Chloroflexi bacterium AL-N5]NOK86334.1 hypothetical protein [Chloroflexi bacterium AL-W]NOK93303.1 hypothetical protein [Chloroflexi bacterium AL-N15]
MTTVETNKLQKDTSTRPRWGLWVVGILGTLLLVILLLVGGTLIYASSNLPESPIAPPTATLNRFDGQYLLALSDADMVATAYADGQLQQVDGIADALTIASLPLDTASPELTELRVSNSVMTWPQIMTVSPDGNTIYVVEGRPELPDDVTQFEDVQRDWPAGEILTRIDLSAGVENAVVETFPIGVNPVHLALTADGDYLAIGLRSAGEHIVENHLAIVPTAELGNPDAYHYFEVENADGEIVEEISSVSWHPSGRYLGVVVDTQEVFFYEVSHGDNGETTVEPFGERFPGGQSLSVGRFSADGRFYFVSELRWSPDNDLLYMLTNPPGEMISIRFDEAGAHEEVSRVQVGQSPEGWTFHPSGQYMVTVNMHRTYAPDNIAFLPGGNQNSLSLVEINQDTGALTVHGHYGFEGVLPEDAVFDTHGDALAVVIYEYREDRPHRVGAIDFWNLVEGDTPTLERSSTSIPVVRGAHIMGLIP